MLEHRIWCTPGFGILDFRCWDSMIGEFQMVYSGFYDLGFRFQWSMVGICTHLPVPIHVNDHNTLGPPVDIIYLTTIAYIFILYTNTLAHISISYISGLTHNIPPPQHTHQCNTPHFSPPIYVIYLHISPPVYEICISYCWPIHLCNIVTRTSAAGMAPIHFPPHPCLLPLPRRLLVHLHALPLLAGHPFPLSALVIFPIIPCLGCTISAHQISPACNLCPFPLYWYLPYFP